MEVHKYHSNIAQKRHGASRNYRYVWDVSITERVKRLADNDIELGIEKPTIESWASNILMTK